MEKVFELSNLTLEAAALKAADPSWSIRLDEEGGGYNQLVSMFQFGITASGSAISGVALYTQDIEVYPEPTEEVPDPEPTIWPAGYYLCLQAVTAVQGEGARAIAWYNDNQAVPVTALDEDGNPAGEVQWLYLGTDPDTTLPIILTVTGETTEIRKQYSIEQLFCEPEDLHEALRIIPVPANTPLPGGKTAADIQNITSYDGASITGTAPLISYWPEFSSRFHAERYFAFTLDIDEHYVVDEVLISGRPGCSSRNVQPNADGIYIAPANHCQSVSVLAHLQGEAATSTKNGSLTISDAYEPEENAKYAFGPVNEEDIDYAIGRMAFSHFSEHTELIPDAQDPTKWTLKADVLHYVDAWTRGVTKLDAGTYAAFLVWLNPYANHSFVCKHQDGTQYFTLSAAKYNCVALPVTATTDIIEVVDNGTAVMTITIDPSTVIETAPNTAQEA